MFILNVSKRHPFSISHHSRFRGHSKHTRWRRVLSREYILQSDWSDPFCSESQAVCTECMHGFNQTLSPRLQWVGSGTRDYAALCVSSWGSCSLSQQHLHTSEYSEDMIQTTHHMIRVCMITADAVTYTCNNQMCCLLLQQYRIGSVLYTLLCVAQGYCILSYSRWAVLLAVGDIKLFFWWRALLERAWFN